MAEPEKNVLQQLIDGVSNWKGSFDQLRERFGWLVAAGLLLLAAVIAASFYIWSNWKDIKERPGADWVIKRFKRRTIDVAPSGHLTIAVAHLTDDEGQKQEKLLLDELGHFDGFDGVETLTVDRMVEWPVSGTEQAKKKKAEEEARGLLRQTGADVLIWGSVISLGGKSRMRLYWTPARDVSGAKSTGQYQPQTETIALPEEFWSDLKQILGLLTQTRLTELTFDQPGQFVADKLAPLIAQVRKLVESKEGVWNPETLARVRFSLANALTLDGEQSGKNEPLAESIALYRKVLDEFTRARVPLQWAMTQNNLGTALFRLGERESGTARLEEAVAAFRDALQEYTRARVPLQWAMTQVNLGNALWRLGERESGTARLEEAVSAYRAALQELTRARAPLQWATAQNNLGTALQTLGGRESGTARLEEAVSAYREALQERTRARVPLEWAGTQNNLGAALQTLGERESGTARLEEAVAAYRAALEENTRARVPLQWAKSTGNQGVALMLLAERRGDAKMAESAVRQIEAAFAAARDGGDAYAAAMFEAQSPKARAIRDRLNAP
jgi:tetratricopeptide (TPR) repeat protein